MSDIACSQRAHMLNVPIVLNVLILHIKISVNCIYEYNNHWCKKTARVGRIATHFLSLWL